MAEIKTRPATPEFRDGWDRIFGKDKTTRPDMGNGYDSDWPSCVYDELPSEASERRRIRFGAHGCVVIEGQGSA